jgi:hypothetical protein
MTDLAFYAPSNFKCGLIQGDLIEHKGKRFTFNIWNFKGMYTLEFKDVSESQVPNFYKHPEHVKKLIDSKELKIIERII